MSRTRLDLHKKRLTRLLRIAPLEQFLLMIWAVDGLQSARSDNARHLIQHSEDHLTDDMKSAYFVHKWLLEDLSNLYFSTRGSLSAQTLDCLALGSWTTLMRELHAVQDAESGIHLNQTDILDELTRIGHKQFDWQTGFLNLPQFYRAAFLFSGPDSTAFFEKQYGLELDKFILMGFATYTQLCARPFLINPPDFSQIDLSAKDFKGFLNLTGITADQAHIKCLELKRGFRSSSFRPSVLRATPCIILDEKISCPLVDLLLLRITDGIYFDLIASDSGTIRTEIGQRFEKYVGALLSSSLPDLSVAPEISYGGRATSRNSPDYLIEHDGHVRLLVECKAKKMTIGTRFNNWPTDRLPRDAEEIAKGIFQIWRFVADCDAGRTPFRSLHKKVCGTILTLESWTNLSPSRRTRLFNRANALANECSTEIKEVHRIPVSFCEIKDLERLTRDADVEALFQTFELASSQDFRGWHLSSILRDQFPKQNADRPYPFKGQLGDLLPWWNKLPFAAS